MLPRSFKVALAALCAALVAVAPASAAISHDVNWDVWVSGKQTVSWSFAAERPEECTSYYGTAGATATGNGKVGLTFTTPKKKPLWAESYLLGGKLRFSSFATDGWRVPAVWSKRGTFSVVPGKPCGWNDDDPVPLPQISDDSGCGTKKLDFGPTIDWADGELTVLGAPSPLPYDPCPGVFEPGAQVDAEAPCTPKGKASGLEGTILQELPIAVSKGEFTAGKAFDVATSHKFLCEFPSKWPDEPPLKVNLKTSYEVTFKPRRR